MREDYLDPNDEILSSEDKEYEKALRPLDFHDFTGQKKVVENIKIFVQAAKMRSEHTENSNTTDFTMKA